jgi:4-nitrophenyl phosphatase
MLGDVIASTLPAIRGVLIDLDGVVYTGEMPIPGASDFLEAARTHRLPFLLVTNNSTTSAPKVADRLARMGISVQPDEILTSSQAAAGYVRKESGGAARVYVVGEVGLRDAIREAGLEVADGGASVDYVVAGLDRSFDYQKLANATRAILAGARFVATNADALLPVEGGGFLPGAGSIVAAISTAADTTPVVIGKPEPTLYLQGLERLGKLAPGDVAMIGDRLDTDIDGARQAGLRTILVLSGVATAEQAAAAEVPPDAVLPGIVNVGALLGWDQTGTEDAC